MLSLVTKRHIPRRGPRRQPPRTRRMVTNDAPEPSPAVVGDQTTAPRAPPGVRQRHRTATPGATPPWVGPKTPPPRPPRGVRRPPQPPPPGATATETPRRKT